MTLQGWAHNRIEWTWQKAKNWDPDLDPFNKWATVTFPASIHTSWVDCKTWFFKTWHQTAESIPGGVCKNAAQHLTNAWWSHTKWIPRYSQTAAQLLDNSWDAGALFKSSLTGACKTPLPAHVKPLPG